MIRCQRADLMSYASPCHLIIQRGSDLAHHVVLQIKQAAGFIGEGIGPEVSAAFGVDQLRIHLDDWSCAPYAPSQSVADVQLAADLARVVRLVFVGEGGSGGDHPGAPQPGKLGRQIVRDCVGQIIVRHVPVDVLERQHNDRIGPGSNLMRLKKYQYRGDRGGCQGPNADGCRQSAPMRDKPRKERHPNPFVGDLVHVDRVRNVLYAVSPAVREEKVGLSARLVVDALADAYRSRRSQGLKPSRDIDAVSVNVALIDEDVPRVDSDPYL